MIVCSLVIAVLEYSYIHKSENCETLVQKIASKRQDMSRSNVTVNCEFKNSHKIVCVVYIFCHLVILKL